MTTICTAVNGAMAAAEHSESEFELGQQIFGDAVA